MGDTYSMYKGSKKWIRILIWKTEGNKPPGRYRCGCDDSIKMDLKKILFEIVDFIKIK
jgi:hypothetical protein